MSHGSRRRTSPSTALPSRRRTKVSLPRDLPAYYDETALAALIIEIAIINAWNRFNAATRQPAGSGWN